MNTKEAKDLIVHQTAAQAAFEGVPLSELEQRMMYFTESDPASCENPLELNDEFEAQYDTPEYEAKISTLLHHAYSRLKKEEPEKRDLWDQAMAMLKRGDHYLLVLWRAEPQSDHPTRDFFRNVGIGVIIAVVIFIGTVIWSSIGGSR